MKNILVLCPTFREFRDLPSLAAALDINLLFDDLGGDYFDITPLKHKSDLLPALEILPLIESTIGNRASDNLSGITSAVGYPGMSAASIIAERLRLKGPSPRSILLCEHKYYSRVAQQKHVPEATPDYYLADPKNPDSVSHICQFPVFLKPVKSCMSMSAFRVDNARQLESLVDTALLPEKFIKPFNDMWRVYFDLPLDASHLLVEELLEGHQVSLEGYVWRGEVQVMGIIDAFMFPGTLSFKRFQYPSLLPVSVKQRMAEIASRFLKGIGYDNAMFNFEMIYNPVSDRISIIEVNPKLSSQFPDLFQKVDGTSSYTIMLQIASGEEPLFTRRQGRFNFAASCVLRTFENKKIERAPTEVEIQALLERFPDAKVQIYARQGRLLSDQLQDSASFRYGLVNIGADSLEELKQKFQSCERSLDFQFSPAQDEPQLSKTAVHATSSFNR